MEGRCKSPVKDSNVERLTRLHRWTPNSIEEGYTLPTLPPESSSRRPSIDLRKDAVYRAYERGCMPGARLSLEGNRCRWAWSYYAPDRRLASIIWNQPTRFGSRNVKRNKHFATKRTSAVLIDYRTDGNVSHTTRNGRQPLTLTKLLKCCRTSIMLRNYRSQKRLEEATKLRRVLRSRTLVSKHFADAPPSLPPFLFGTCGSADGR